MLGTVINLILQIFSGAFGGHLADAARGNNLSKLEKTIMGAVGGVIGGQVLGMFIPFLANGAEPSMSEAIGQAIDCWRHRGRSFHHDSRTDQEQIVGIVFASLPAPSAAP